MLYLVRKIGESIIINGDIEVKIVEVKNKHAKIGIDFPKTSTVLRKEVHDRVVAENMAAASADISLDDMSAFDDIATNKD